MGRWAMEYGMLLVMRLDDNNRIDVLILVWTQVLVFTLRGRTAGVVVVMVVVMSPVHNMRLLGVIVVRLQMWRMWLLLASWEDVIVWRVFVPLDWRYDSR